MLEICVGVALFKAPQYFGHSADIFSRHHECRISIIMSSNVGLVNFLTRRVVQISLTKTFSKTQYISTYRRHV